MRPVCNEASVCAVVSWRLRCVHVWQVRVLAGVSELVGESLEAAARRRIVLRAVRDDEGRAPSHIPYIRVVDRARTGEGPHSCCDLA